MLNLFDTPILLHFLDRELRASISARLNDDEVLDIIEVAMFLTMNQLYIGTSLVWENMSCFPISINTLIDLEQMGEVRFLNNHATLDEFLASRKPLYINDRDRYPMYFSDSVEDKPWPRNLFLLNDSTTEQLEGNLKKIIDGKQASIKELQNANLPITGEVYEIIDTASRLRDGQAITFNLFEKHIDSGVNQIQNQYTIRRTISLLYTGRYMKALGGTIVTGIRGFQFFDGLCDNKIFYSYQINKLIFQNLGMLYSSNLNVHQRIANIMRLKQDPLFKEFLILQRSMINGIKYIIGCGQSEGDIHVKVANMIKEVLRPLPLIPETSTISLSTAYIRLEGICRTMMDNELFYTGYNEIKSQSKRKRILLVTATLTELKSLMQVIKANNIQCKRFTRGKHTYFALVGLGNNDVYIFKTEMGSSGTGGSIMAINDAIDSINPDFVIMVGIAFGMNKDKQKLGDILVSKQIWSYEPAKFFDKKSVSRGDKITASPILLDRLQVSSINWGKTKIEFGLIVSGEKLVNSERFIKRLRSKEPEAIGGDMEGTGLATVCQSVKKDWILVKAICDWGYKKTGDFQEMASQNAIEYVLWSITNYFD